MSRQKTVSKNELAYLNENEPDEGLRKWINDWEDTIADPNRDKSKAAPIDYYRDAVGHKDLKKGTILYQIASPGNTNSMYFTDEKTVSKCRNKAGEVDSEKLLKMIQVKDASHSKSEVTKYKVTKDVRVPGGKCVINNQHGGGGGNQYIFLSSEQKEQCLKKISVEKTANQNKASTRFADSLKKEAPHPLQGQSKFAQHLEQLKGERNGKDRAKSERPQKDTSNRKPQELSSKQQAAAEKRAAQARKKYNGMSQ